jgi:hypothetical protein
VIRLRLVRLAPLLLVLCNLVLVTVNLVTMHRNGQILRDAMAIRQQALDLIEPLPPHPCGEVIQPQETCTMTFRGRPPATALRYHGP